MSYKTLITNNVTNAFNLVGDIAEDMTFTNETVSGYDFANQTITTVKSKVLKGNIQEKLEVIKNIDEDLIKKKIKEKLNINKDQLKDKLKKLITN